MECWSWSWGGQGEEGKAWGQVAFLGSGSEANQSLLSIRIGSGVRFPGRSFSSAFGIRFPDVGLQLLSDLSFGARWGGGIGHLVAMLAGKWDLHS